MAAKKKEAAPSVPSSEAVDAYKTYLLKSLPTYSAKDFAAGAPISVDQVDKDILITENKISQYKKFGFNCDKEEKQLEILKDYKKKVIGKVWPGNPQPSIPTCLHPFTTTFLTATGIEMKRCPTCNKVWEIPKKISSIYYDPELIKNLKANIPIGLSKSILIDDAPRQITLRVGRAEIDQKLIMRMGMMSNCNVSIAKVMIAGYLEKVVLHCSKCDEKTTVSESILISKNNGLPVIIEEFCTIHRHNAKVDGKTGRLFREENE